MVHCHTCSWRYPIHHCSPPTASHPSLHASSPTANHPSLPAAPHCQPPLTACLSSHCLTSYCAPTASPALLGSNKKVTSRKMARKQARLEKKARRSNKTQEGLPQCPPQGHGTAREVHGQGKKRSADSSAAGSASRLEGSSQTSHISSNMTEVSGLGLEVLSTACVIVFCECKATGSKK